MALEYRSKICGRIFKQKSAIAILFAECNYEALKAQNKNQNYKKPEGGAMKNFVDKPRVYVQNHADERHAGISTPHGQDGLCSIERGSRISCLTPMALRRRANRPNTEPHDHDLTP
jgi:hypothetical protein